MYVLYQNFIVCFIGFGDRLHLMFCRGDIGTGEGMNSRLLPTFQVGM
nr:MAG TPA: hypothetical protein [Caudoviricetes sp.]